MSHVLTWLRDLVITIREIAKAVAYARSHPHDPPKHDGDA